MTFDLSLLWKDYIDVKVLLVSVWSITDVLVHRFLEVSVFRLGTVSYFIGR